MTVLKNFSSLTKQFTRSLSACGLKFAESAVHSGKLCVQVSLDCEYKRARMLVCRGIVKVVEFRDVLDESR